MGSGIQFLTHRVPVLGRRGMVASTQPLASEAGLRILQQGGNAADAAVAVAAALNVTEPASTGIGGDACALFYNRAKRRVECQVGFGRSPAALTRAHVLNAGFKGCRLPDQHGLTVTVPGAAQLWEDTLTHWGTLSLKKVLGPAIELCEDGFPVAPITAECWKKSMDRLGKGSLCFKTASGDAPLAGQLMKNPDLGQTFRTIGEQGTQMGFYHGRIAEAIVKAVKEIGGVLELEDLDAHRGSEPSTPCSTQYRGYTVWQVPPPSQGVVVLAALNHLEELVQDMSRMQWGSEDVLHAQIEALRLAFFDALHVNADPETSTVPTDKIVCKEEAAKQRSRHKLSRQASSLKSRDRGEARPDADASDTVYFCVVDGDGNACSFINSTFMMFGTGVVPDGCGFMLHNRSTERMHSTKGLLSRGYNFCTMASHPNSIGPLKRPYNTIIPGLCTDKEGDLFCAFGVMGGFMQPQGHLQVLSNMIDFNMNPQAALDAPRFCITGVDSSLGPASVEKSRSGITNTFRSLKELSRVSLEAGFGSEVRKQLKERGHDVEAQEDCFYGRGQIIVRTSDGILWGGTEPRADGSVVCW